ncbi:hypothetical protein PENSPDRAFT_240979 [Peniophora sp. CONT]|nr:hypothetical protein PENSPDRAFT_240979 [Peniophora sp. CONT]
MIDGRATWFERSSDLRSDAGTGSSMLGIRQRRGCGEQGLKKPAKLQQSAKSKRRKYRHPPHPPPAPAVNLNHQCRAHASSFGRISRPRRARSHLRMSSLGAGIRPPRLLLQVHTGLLRTTSWRTVPWSTCSESAETLLILARTRLNSRLFEQIMSPPRIASLRTAIAWRSSRSTGRAGLTERLRGSKMK